MARPRSWECPSCGGVGSLRVSDSRFVRHGYKRRRYRCLACRHRFTTYEVPGVADGARGIGIVRMPGSAIAVAGTLELDRGLWRFVPLVESSPCYYCYGTAPGCPACEGKGLPPAWPSPVG